MGGDRRRHAASATEAGQRRSVRVDGAWRILDGKDGELLIYTLEVQPHVRRCVVVHDLELGGGTKRRRQRDIHRAKELLAEYRARQAKLKKETPGEQRRGKKR